MTELKCDYDYNYYCYLLQLLLLAVVAVVVARRVVRTCKERCGVFRGLHA